MDDRVWELLGDLFQSRYDYPVRKGQQQVAKGTYAQCLLHQIDVTNPIAAPYRTPFANIAPIPTKNTTSIETCWHD